MGTHADVRLPGFFLICLAALLPAAAEARIIRIDQSLNWGDPVIVNAESDGSALAPLGFAVDFGQGPVSALTIHENGFVSFSGGNSITALDVDFASDASAEGTESPGAVSYNQGLIDPNAEFQPGVTPPDAFRVQWVDQAAFQVMQILLISLGGGDFDLEINHGCDGRPNCDGVTPVGNALTATGFKLGGASFSRQGPFTLNDDFTFSFRDGQVTGVPEPAAAPLLLAGLALLVLFRWRWRGGRRLRPVCNALVT